MDVRWGRSFCVSDVILCLNSCWMAAITAFCQAIVAVR
jgi:hypothetical protein